MNLSPFVTPFSFVIEPKEILCVTLVTKMVILIYRYILLIIRKEVSVTNVTLRVLKMGYKVTNLCFPGSIVTL